MNTHTLSFLKFYFICIITCSGWFQHNRLNAQTLIALAHQHNTLTQSSAIQHLSDAPDDELTYTSVDSVSYALYLNADWKTLSTFCETAIKKGYNYYYLQLRAGIAYFQLNQFRKAIMHFDEALKFNSEDEVSASYLYACYLYSERFEEAKHITKAIGPAISESMKIKDLSPVDFLNVESGFKHSDSSKLYKNALFTSVGLQHSIARKFFLFHSVSYYTQEESRFKVQQFQYYLKGAVALKKNLLLTVGAHYINDQSEIPKYIAVTNTVLVTNTVQVQPGGPGNPVTTQTVQFVESGITTGTTTTQRASQGFVAAATILKQTTFVNYSAGFTASFLDTVRQYQLHAGLTFFPLKNNRLSFGVTTYQQNSQKKTKSNSVAVTPFISAYPTKHLYLTVSYFNNLGNNIVENTGYLVNNSIDYTRSRYSFSASQKLFNNTWIYATYSYETKKNLTQPFMYNYNVVVVGFKIFPSAI